MHEEYHASEHENSGEDELNVGGLSGELADAQPPKTHNLGGSEHGSDTLANLITKVSDVTKFFTNIAGEIAGVAEKTTVTALDIFLIEDQADGNKKKKVQVGNLLVFGSGFAETSVDAEDTNVTTALEDRVDYTTASLTSGQKYRIGFFFEGKVANPGEKAEYQIEIDSVVRSNPVIKDNYYIDQAGYYYYTPGSTGTKIIKIQYRVATGTTGTAYIKNARIEIWRVA